MEKENAENKRPKRAPSWSSRMEVKKKAVPLMRRGDLEQMTFCDDDGKGIVSIKMRGERDLTHVVVKVYYPKKQNQNKGPI